MSLPDAHTPMILREMITFLAAADDGDAVVGVMLILIGRRARRELALCDVVSLTYIHGINGKNEISSGGLAYLIAEKLNKGNKKLSLLAIVSALNRLILLMIFHFFHLFHVCMGLVNIIGHQCNRSF